MKALDALLKGVDPEIAEAIRELFTTQATAHTAQMDALRAQMATLRAQMESLGKDLQLKDKDMQTKDDEIARANYLVDEMRGRMDLRSVVEFIVTEVQQQFLACGYEESEVPRTTTGMMELICSDEYPDFQAYLKQIAESGQFHTSVRSLQQAGQQVYGFLSSSLHHGRTSDNTMPSYPVAVVPNNDMMLFLQALFKFFSRNVAFYHGAKDDPRARVTIPSPPRQRARSGSRASSSGSGDGGAAGAGGAGSGSAGQHRDDEGHPDNEGHRKKRGRHESASDTSAVASSVGESGAGSSTAGAAGHHEGHGEGEGGRLAASADAGPR